MAGLFENILTNIKEKKQEGKLKTGYRFSDDGKLSVGGGYYDEDKMLEVEIGKDGGNILFKKRFAAGGIVEQLGLQNKIKELFDAGKGAPTITKELKIIFPAQADKIKQNTIGNYLKYAKQNLGWKDPVNKTTNQFGSKLTETDIVKRKANVERLIKSDPEKYFNQKETAKLIGKDQAALVKPKDYPKPGKQRTVEKSKGNILRGERYKKANANAGSKANSLNKKLYTKYITEQNNKLRQDFKNSPQKTIKTIKNNKLLMSQLETSFDSKTGEFKTKSINNNKIKSIIQNGMYSVEHTSPMFKGSKNTNFPTNTSLVTNRANTKIMRPLNTFLNSNKYKDFTDPRVVKVKDFLVNNNLRTKINNMPGYFGADLSKLSAEEIFAKQNKNIKLGSFPAQLAEAPQMSKGAIKAAAKSVGKVLGVAALPLEAYFMKQMYDEGKTMTEILSSPLMLDSVVGDAQDLLKMNSLERQAVTNERISQDESLLDTDFSQPYREGLQSVNTEMVKERVAQERAAEEAKRVAKRNKLKQSFTLEPFLGIKSFDSEV